MCPLSNKCFFITYERYILSVFTETRYMYIVDSIQQFHIFDCLYNLQYGHRAFYNTRRPGALSAKSAYDVHCSYTNQTELSSIPKKIFGRKRCCFLIGLPSQSLVCSAITTRPLLLLFLLLVAQSLIPPS